MSGTLVRKPENVTWELRVAWGRRKPVRLTLSERCVLQTIVGTVSRVAVTGAFVTVAGWHVPTDEILAIGKPTPLDVEEYQATIRRLREKIW